MDSLYGEIEVIIGTKIMHYILSTDSGQLDRSISRISMPDGTN